jgi:hypothetical protein
MAQFTEATMAPRITDKLATLFARFVEGYAGGNRGLRNVNAQRARRLARLEQKGVVTVGDLLKRLPVLPKKSKEFGVELMYLLGIRQAIPLLLQMWIDPKIRLACAVALSRLKPRSEVIREIVQIGWRELRSKNPDRLWLEAFIHAAGNSGRAGSDDLLLAMLESVELPGWLRGDAADKLGCSTLIADRRTAFFRRARDAALRGLSERSIDVQFWSMYLIGSLASRNGPHRSNAGGCEAALPRLRRIAKRDHRLAPGYWWPMSAEAEDAIICIETGRWPDPDAGERWSDTTKRGEWNRK